MVIPFPVSCPVSGASENVAPAPQTLASGLSKVEGLNERLNSIRAHAGKLVGMMGALYPLPGENGGCSDRPEPDGVVCRLNSSADCAHRTLDDIDALLLSIGRSLG